MEENGIEKLHQSNQLCLFENDRQQGGVIHKLLGENIYHSAKVHRLNYLRVCSRILPSASSGMSINMCAKGRATEVPDLES